MDNRHSTIIGLFLLLALPMAFADLGPKPTMDFSLSYNTSATISIVGGEQYQCSDRACSDMDPLGQKGPQRFGCNDDNECHSLAYGYDNYQKLVIEFSDGKTRESNAFPSNSGSYKVVVNEDGMIVTSLGILPVIDDVTGIMSLVIAILVALVITLIIELILSYLYLSFKKIKKPKDILPSVAIANIISVPILWIVVSAFLGLASFVIMEILVVIFEAYLIHMMNKKKIKLKDSFIMSIAMNIASIIIGALLLILLA